ncbi:MAG: hypothetical protein WCJ40_08345 [Planctomycetota bacterium]
MKSIKSLVSATLAVISMMALGCGESGPRLVSVSGKVSVDGKPMEGLVLSFLPDPSNPGALPSENEVAADGTYTAYTQGRKGLMPGKYHVVILRGPAAAAIVKAEQSAANNETFKDDPFMAAASEAPAKKKDQKVLKFFEIAFDKVVPEEGGTMNFDGEMKNATPYK